MSDDDHASSIKYRRVLLKLSGEALQSGDQSITAANLDAVVTDVKALLDLGIQVAIVIGGGNWLRGRSLSCEGVEQYTADQMGILFTVANGLALRDAFQSHSIPVSLMSSLPIETVVDAYDKKRAIEVLEHNQVVIFVAGVGTPLFSTDSAASLRAIDIHADILLKASTVDAVYSEDPKVNPKAEKFSRLTYQYVIEHGLKVMDMSAFCLCQEHEMPIRIFDAKKPDVLLQIIHGADEGTLIEKGAKK